MDKYLIKMPVKSKNNVLPEEVCIKWHIKKESLINNDLFR